MIGSSVLIFVSGMSEIIEVCERIEALNSTKYKVIPIHSELPDEEQAQIFVKESKVRYLYIR